MIGHAPRTDSLRTHRRWRVPDGVTLLELLCAVVVVAVITTAAWSGATAYDRSRRAPRVAALVQWEITVARGYAIRSGRSMSLVVDERARSIRLRDGASTWRQLSLGDGTPMQVDDISLEIPGDSLVFSPRGLCTNCSQTGLTSFRVRAGSRTATIEIGMLGHPELALEGIDSGG